MGFMLAPIQSRVTIPSFVLLSFSLFLSRSLSLVRSFVRPFSLLVPPHPLRLTPAHPPALPSPIYREEVSHTTDSRQFSHLESQNFSLPSSSLPRCIPPFSLASFGVSRTPDIYVYSCAFRFHSFRRCTRISHPPHPPLPSSSCSRSARSLLSPLVPREHVREVRFPLASLSLPPRQPALVLLVLFAPFRFTTGAGRFCPSSLFTALPALAITARSPFCIARLPPPTSRFSPRLCPFPS